MYRSGLDLKLTCCAKHCQAVLPLAILMLSGVGHAFAQLPVTQLHSVFPPGGQQGTEVAVTISGSDLDDVRQLVFSHPGISSKPKLTARPFADEQIPVPQQFLVSISPEVPVGQYEARAIGHFGVSNPRAFLVGDVPSAVESEPNETLDQATPITVGSIVHGQSDAGSPDFYKFKALANQHLLIECQAPRIDSLMDPRLVIFDSAGRELQRSLRSGLQAGPIAFMPSHDGEYALRIFDGLYRGGHEYFYQLSVSAGPRIDFVLPPCGEPGTKSAFTIYGSNLPGGIAADGVSVNGRKLEKLTTEIELPSLDQATNLLSGSFIAPPETVLDGFEYRLQSPLGTSNPILIGYATAPIALEHEPNDKLADAQRVTVPCECVGQFAPQGDLDGFLFEAKKGETFWIEVFSQRLGLATDPSFAIERLTKDGQGQLKVSDIRQEDDYGPNIGGQIFSTNTGDPQYRFSVPEDGTYRVLVRDLYASGDPRSVYRLSIRTERPDFRIVAFPQPLSDRPTNQQQAAIWSTLLRKGGAEALQVLAFRRDGFAGEIEVSVEGLPLGVHAEPAIIGPGKNVATLVLTAALDASTWSGSIRLIGKARIGETELVRTARAATIVWPPQQNGPPAVGRMASDLALAVSETETAPFTLSLGEGKRHEVSQSGTVSIPVKITRHGDFKEKVAINPLDLPPNVEAANVTIAANQTEAKLELKASSNAPLGSYTFHLRADADLSYRRHPEAVATAEAEKKRLEAVAVELTSRGGDADNEKKAIEAAIADAAKRLKEAEEAAKPKNIDLFVPAAVRVKIVEKPKPEAKK